MPALQLIPEELEKAADTAVANCITCVEVCGIMVLGRFAVLEGMDSLVDVLHPFDEGRGAQQRINKALLEEVEPRHLARG